MPSCINCQWQKWQTLTDPNGYCVAIIGTIWEAMQLMEDHFTAVWQNLLLPEKSQH
jgi:hypothetical protein